MNTKTDTAKRPIEILIVEDNQTEAEKLRVTLEAEGYQIRHAKNAKQAIDYLGEYHPALVISESMMPLMNGYELCKKIKLSASTCDIPVILMTSLTSAEDALESLTCGADRFITKPFRESYLLNQIEGLLTDTLLDQKERVEISLTNQNRKITIDQQGLLSLLISTYETAIEQGKKLIETEDELFTINENLKELLEEKTIQITEMVQDISERRRNQEQHQLYLEDLLESQRIAHIGTWRLNIATNQVVWSDELYKMYGFDPSFPPPPFTEHMKLFTPESWEILSIALESAKTFGIPYELELKTIKADGSNGWMWVQGAAKKDPSGNIISLWGAAQDITERKQAEALLKESEEKYRLLYTAMSQGIALHEIITDADGKPVDYVFLDINDSYTQLLGVTREMCIGKRITEVMPKVEKYWIDIFGEVALTGAPSYYENYLETTGRYYATYTYSPKKRQFAVLVTDITEQKKNQERLMYMSYHDQLTGLYNRRFFEEQLNRQDTKENLPLTIIMGDINGLKIINDSFGHEVGDDYLKKTSEIIQKACRADDIIARLGGDEFVVILPNADTSEAIKIIDHIKAMIAETTVNAIELSVSFGFATKASADQSLLETVIGAENYMYTQKIYEHTSMRSKTIDLIMNTLFEKSDRESKHSNRVSAICEAIADKMNFINDDVNQIRIAGLIHDIGKIGIKEEILNKAGSLNNDEWAAIKKHPEAGWRILSATTEFSEVSEFVLRHHEKWDGSGYPNGLSGDEIPIEARIIAVADAYDAMTSERSYKKGCSKDEAVNELKRCSGTHFDPIIVEAFVNKVMPHNSNFGKGGENLPPIYS